MLRPCAQPGCSALVTHGYCLTHQRERRRWDRRYSTGAGVNYGRAWLRARDAFLRDHPFCACGCGRAADTVDHIVPHRGDRLLFWDQANWQALAAYPCHSAKTAREVLHPSK